MNKTHIYILTGFFILSLIFLESCNKITKTGAAICEFSQKNDAIPLIYSDKTDTANKQLEQNLDALFRQRHQGAHFNGAALVAVKGKIVYENYFGLGNMNTHDTITANSTFHIASVSKTFTAMAVLWLHQQGKLDINANVTQYLPDFPYKNITVSALLKHRSGLANYSYFAEKAYKDTTAILTNQGVLYELKKQNIPLQYAPDTHFQYCNTNYAVLASIIEVVTKTKYADFMACAFFNPLGMTNTFVYQAATNPVLPKNATISYIGNRENPLEFDDGVVGDKNIYSNVQDLYRWDRALRSGRILPDSLLQKAYTPYSNERPGIKNYGLGWRLLVYPDNQKIMYHNGWWHGNTASIYRFQNQDFTFIVLANRYNRTVYQMQPVYDIVNGKVNNMGFEEE